jgi:hypothetical protein
MTRHSNVKGSIGEEITVHPAAAVDRIDQRPVPRRSLSIEYYY